jgi:hypothetical protein
VGGTGDGAVWRDWGGYGREREAGPCVEIENGGIGEGAVWRDWGGYGRERKAGPPIKKGKRVDRTERVVAR